MGGIGRIQVTWPAETTYSTGGDLDEGRHRCHATARWPDLGEFLSAQTHWIIACDYGASIP